MRMVVLSVLLLVAVAPVYAAGADKAVSDDCRDDQGKDRCARQMQEKMRASYGLEDVEALMKAGVSLRRAMYVDGYGNDEVAISFIRKPGASPFVEIRSPCVGEKDCPAPLVAPVASKTWDRIITWSENFDEKLAREIEKQDQGDDKAIRICLHSWVVVAEAVDAPEIDQFSQKHGTEKGTIRKDTEDACVDGLAVPFAFRLADAAFESLPECSTLNPAHFRNVPTLLSYCTYLRGDRIAAGEAYALVRELNAIEPNEATDFEKFFKYDVQSRAADLARDVGKGNLSIWAPEALDRDNAKAKGAVYFEDEDSDKQFIAEIELMLVRESDGFLITGYTMSERKPLEDKD